MSTPLNQDSVTDLPNENVRNAWTSWCGRCYQVTVHEGDIWRKRCTRHARVCVVCTRDLPDGDDGYQHQRNWKSYCSNACRQKAYRQAKRGTS